jgi:hypothetical protein
VSPNIQPGDGADGEPQYYPVSHEFNPTIRRHSRRRSRQLIVASLDRQSRSVDKDYDTLVDMMATLMNDVGRCYEETVALLC